MAQEIERKYLLKNMLWKELAANSVHMTQGYFPASGVTVRVRIAGDRSYLTIKGKSDEFFARSEFEYPIPQADAKKMLDEFCRDRVVEKIRYFVPAGGGLTWEIDEYLGTNAGLYTAEIELPSIDTVYSIPDWIGDDISSCPEYSNGSLSKRPYSMWGNK